MILSNSSKHLQVHGLPWMHMISQPSHHQTSLSKPSKSKQISFIMMYHFSNKILLASEKQAISLLKKNTPDLFSES